MSNGQDQFGLVLLTLDEGSIPGDEELFALFGEDRVFFIPGDRLPIAEGLEHPLDLQLMGRRDKYLRPGLPQNLLGLEPRDFLGLPVKKLYLPSEIGDDNKTV